MRFVLEMSERERDAIKKAGRSIKDSFKKVKGSFQVRIVKEKGKSRRKSRRKKKR